MGVMYAICDRVVDEYEKVGASLEIDVDEVEESVFSPARTDDSVRIYALKREIAEVRRAGAAFLAMRGRIERLVLALLNGGAGAAKMPPAVAFEPRFECTTPITMARAMARRC